MSLNFLSRTLVPSDLFLLHRELQYVDHHLQDTTALDKRWSYALALHAVRRWLATEDHALRDTLYDVGGAGSAFHFMLDEWTHRHTIVLDPRTPSCPHAISTTLAAFVIGDAPLADIITAHQVIEHVDDPDRFLYHLSCLLAPGGLLVLTFAFWPRCGSDTAHGHEHRARIYCPKLLAHLRIMAEQYQLRTFGGFDGTYHGEHLHDYTLHSLVLEKLR